MTVDIEAIYLAPTTAILGLGFDDCFGLMETIGSNHDTRKWPAWAVDNGRFTGAWTETKWRSMLESYVDLSRCLFAVVPDRPFDASETLAEFRRYAPFVRGLGYPVALATQNGMEPEGIPWADIDALFIGGDDQHKRGSEAGRLIAEAMRIGKWIHIGRVNSGRCIVQHFWMANSWDGQTLARHPFQQYKSIARAVRIVREKQRQRTLL